MRVDIRWDGEFIDDAYWDGQSHPEEHERTNDCWDGTVRECGCGWAYSAGILNERMALLAEAISHQIDNDFDLLKEHQNA